MNLGQLRRQERQAMHQLISRGLMKRDEFSLVEGDGSETVSAPPDGVPAPPTPSGETWVN
jgi:hypothetical protein